MYPAFLEYLNRQRIIPNCGGELWKLRYLYFFPVSLFVSVYVYASVCNFVCIALLLPFVLELCLPILFFSLVQFLALLIIGEFLYWIDCSLLYFSQITF